METHNISQICLSAHTYIGLSNCCHDRWWWVAFLMYYNMQILAILRVKRLANKDFVS
jgi:hypothetical protein